DGLDGRPILFFPLIINYNLVLVNYNRLVLSVEAPQAAVLLRRRFHLVLALGPKKRKEAAIEAEGPFYWAKPNKKSH
ncbi:MAG: hypothetical protein ACT6SG_20750, partial [Hydrogenophaga sp.]|uniref:hypothetical protein n=1 Tax=Hydrogenophaga sp. TaxID=1904254 RepID=UPI00403541B7